MFIEEYLLITQYGHGEWSYRWITWILQYVTRQQREAIERTPTTELVVGVELFSGWSWIGIIQE
jgi:hypothetical protein